MEVKVISAHARIVEEKVNEFIKNNKDKEIVDVHFTQDGAKVNAFIMLTEKPLQKLTDEEVRILKNLVFGSPARKDAPGKFDYNVLYVLKKLKSYGVVEFDDESNVRMCEWAKPKFLFEYLFDKEQKNIVMLLKKEGELKQIDITNKTSIPRTTLSRRLEELESMGVVERRLDGPSKNVRLSEPFGKNF